MGLLVRKATAADAAGWVDLVRSALGDDYPDKSVYDSAWVTQQFLAQDANETWLVESNGRILGSACFLLPVPTNANPIGNLGRNMFHPDSYSDGSAEALLRKIVELGAERGLMMIARVLASDNRQQILFENLGFSCAGFQPFKHLHRMREGVLFYVRFGRPDRVARLPLSESLPQVSDLAATVLSGLKIPNPMIVKDGVTGYPLQTEIQIRDTSYQEFNHLRIQVQSDNPPVEISGGYNLGMGYLRIEGAGTIRGYMGMRENRVVGGIAYHFDERDRCMRLVDGFSVDDLSMGGLLRHAIKLAQEQLNAVYVEVDVLMTAPRLLKTAEQLGFVPVAYMPALFIRGDRHADVVKMVKLNMVYELENATLTTNARTIIKIVDQNFQDQKVGIAIINLLRGLPIFDGLGDGELRKIARLFIQKLFRPGEKIFRKGDSGSEAYVVMRGQIEICLEEGAKPIAVIGNGQIFGELAFLDGAARGAMATASQPSILLVVQRSAFYDLVQREPHLGMVVMRNIALILSERLRKTNQAMSTRK
jgi:hypothetical protein